MNKSRFTEKEIKLAINQMEKGVPVKDICIIMGISHSTLYAWKYRYGNNMDNAKEKTIIMDVSIKKLKEEVARLKREKQELLAVIQRLLIL